MSLGIKEEIFEQVYKEYKDLEKRVDKFNNENKIEKTSKKGLSIFDNNYTEGIEANSRIFETSTQGYRSLKYALFYDYTTLIVNFTSNKAVLQKSFKIYEDMESIRGKIFNIEELEHRVYDKEKLKVEEEIEL